MSAGKLLDTSQARPGGWAESTGWAGLAYECWMLIGEWWRETRARRRLWIERRRPQPRLLSICERLDLGPKQSLIVVAYGARRFLIASGANPVAAMIEISPTAGPVTPDRLPLVWPARWSEQ